ncbi:hypothetical protein [Nocardia sp. NPDC004604]|uniref:hypothetical protein n=1 Tax=Nocardia sp. NPDC004604 TaxID=3157013 RepID=UPI0033A98687
MVAGSNPVSPTRVARAGALPEVVDDSGEFVDLDLDIASVDPAGLAAMAVQLGVACIAEAEDKAVRMVPVLPDSIDESTPKAVAEFFDYYT